MPFFEETLCNHFMQMINIWLFAFIKVHLNGKVPFNGLSYLNAKL